MSLPEVVTRDSWLAARKELLAKEKEMTRRRDALNAERRRLPMVEIEKDYVFEGPEGAASGRGAEMTGGSYYFLDLTALGRQEEWEEPKGRAASAHAARPDFAD